MAPGQPQRLKPVHVGEHRRGEHPDVLTKRHTCSRNDVSKALPLPRRIEPVQAPATMAEEGCAPASQPLYGSMCACQWSPCSPECLRLQACAKHGYTCFAMGARAGAVRGRGIVCRGGVINKQDARPNTSCSNCQPPAAGCCSCGPPQQRRNWSLRPCPLLPAERGSAVADVRAVLRAGSPPNRLAVRPSHDLHARVRGFDVTVGCWRPPDRHVAPLCIRLRTRTAHWTSKRMDQAVWQIQPDQRRIPQFRLSAI